MNHTRSSGRYFCVQAPVEVDIPVAAVDDNKPDPMDLLEYLLYALLILLFLAAIIALLCLSRRTGETQLKINAQGLWEYAPLVNPPTHRFII